MDTTRALADVLASEWSRTACPTWRARPTRSALVRIQPPAGGGLAVPCCVPAGMEGQARPQTRAGLPKWRSPQPPWLWALRLCHLTTALMERSTAILCRALCRPGGLR